MKNKVILQGSFVFVIPAIIKDLDCEYSVWVDGVGLKLKGGKQINFSFNDPMISAIECGRDIAVEFRSKSFECDCLYDCISSSLYNNEIEEIFLDVKLQFNNPETSKMEEWGVEKIASQIPFYLNRIGIVKVIDDESWHTCFIDKKVIDGYNQSLKK